MNTQLKKKNINILKEWRFDPEVALINKRVALLINQLLITHKSEHFLPKVEFKVPITSLLATACFHKPWVLRPLLFSSLVNSMLTMLASFYRFFSKSS